MIQTQNISQIFDLTAGNFNEKAIEFFYHQMSNGAFYQKYLATLGRNTDQIQSWQNIPFLPIRFFKSHKISTLQTEKILSHSPLVVFESSGTTGQINSKHFVNDLSLYERSFITCFEKFYGPVGDFCILGLLPSYLEKGHSSLVYMTDKLIQKSGHPLSGFYLYDHEEMFSKLQLLEQQGQKTLLIGVTYALLDFAEKFPIKLKHTFIMETGGMKGRRAEMIREEVHQQLMQAFDLPNIHAEYGMTELLSQAYSKGNGVFQCPPWMKVVVRNVSDPFQISENGKGVLNIIDLANIHSCCFIATDDLGEVFEDGSFVVNGRLDNSDLRGCSLMYEN